MSRLQAAWNALWGKIAEKPPLPFRVCGEIFSRRITDSDSTNPHLAIEQYEAKRLRDTDQYDVWMHKYHDTASGIEPIQSVCIGEAVTLDHAINAMEQHSQRSYLLSQRDIYYPLPQPNVRMIAAQHGILYHGSLRAIPQPVTPN